MELPKRKQPEEWAKSPANKKPRTSGTEGLDESEIPTATVAPGVGDAPTNTSTDSSDNTSVLPLHVDDPTESSSNRDINDEDMMSEINDLKRGFTRLDKTVSQLTQKYLDPMSVPREIVVLSNIIREVEKERDDSRLKLQGVREELNASKQRVEQLIEDMELTGCVQRSAPDLDDVIKTQFVSLRREIRSFIRTVCDKKIEAALDDHLKGLFKLISGLSPTAFLRSGLHARYFVEGLVWHCLHTWILHNPFTIFGTRAAIATIAATVEALPKPIKHRELWRILSGQLIGEACPPSNAKIQGWQKKLASTIQPLVMAQESEHVMEHVEPIVRNTIELAKNLAQSRTQTIIKIRESTVKVAMLYQPYDENWMEIVEQNLSHYDDVDFVVSPALVQLTNSAGDTFTEPRVMVKAEVCYGRGRVHEASGHSLDELHEHDESTIQMTGSGRQNRPVVRFGETVDETTVSQIVGDDQDNDAAPEPESDGYVEHKSESDDDKE
ncbi:hypothetical protein F4777DRAFT_592855 [Nemania sp. FL0916]|nr:hypothetical protein F4777DRAFT_592855 [Nemania sp. FL0916]